MVMEALPTPDAVGREFVRQYYTLLNQAPAHAHRFYNSNSYFVHGAMSKPAIGQRQIHQKIQQLNFRDCHAKISQVDSQATLGNGLVVQVSGELSNDGEPMRRFTQTFVLGTHSPRMYYVHNDIFRYQDMLLSDEETESPSQEEEAEQPQDMQQDNQNIQYFNPSNAAPAEVPMAPNQGNGQGVFLNGTTLHNETVQGVQTQAPPPQEQPPVINGRVAAEDIAANEEYSVATQTTNQPDNRSPKDKNNRPGPTKMETESTSPVETEVPKPESETFTPEIQDLHISETSNEPKTYANLLKMDRMSSGPAGASTSAVMNRTTTIYNTSSTSGGPGNQRMDESPQQSRPQRGGRGGPSRGNNRKDRSSGPSRSSFNEDGGPVMGPSTAETQERRRNPVPYSDHHQLFMGNLPLDATEEELRDLFSKFGNIVDLRIHSKQSSAPKGPPGMNRVPNYGFITFENPDSVQEVLKHKPILFPRDGGIKLNVEEKKTKMRSSLSSQGGGGGGLGGGGGGGGGGRGDSDRDRDRDRDRDGGGRGGPGSSNTSERGGERGGSGGLGTSSGGGGGGGGGGGNAGGGGGGGNESWSSGRAPIRGGPPSRGSRGGGARGNFNRDSRGPPPNQRSNFPPRR